MQEGFDTRPYRKAMSTALSRVAIRVFIISSGLIMSSSLSFQSASSVCSEAALTFGQAR